MTVDALWEPVYIATMLIRGTIHLFALGLVVLTHAGCNSPFVASTEQELQRHFLTSHQAHLAAVAAGPVIEMQRPASEVEQKLPDERRQQLDEMSGPDAYEEQPLKLGPDLLGNEDSLTVGMTLRRAIEMVVKNNLVVHAAQLQPAISQTQVTQAEAAFDAVFFMDFNQEKRDTPRPSTGFATVAFGQQKTGLTQLITGVRKQLSSGGQITAQTRIARQYQNPSLFDVSEFYEADILITLQQPLLRNFGQDVNRAQIQLTRNARAEFEQDLRSTLIDAAFVAEQTFWSLVLTRQRLLIQQRLLDRTIKARDTIEARLLVDATPAQLTEANSFVGLRRAEVIRADRDLRSSSDTLKRLIYADDLPVSGETLILPLDEPADVPIEYSLLDSVSTALRHRPDLQRRLLEIKDASIQQRVADNQRLPLLDITATMQPSGVGNHADDAYDDQLTEVDFVDYIIALQFEAPFGNREREAQFRQRQLERSLAVLNYQATAQLTVVELKDALRESQTNYLLIGATRDARRAAADNVRTLEDQEEAGAALTPEFTNRKLRRLEALADSEIQEMQAMTDYMVAIARFYRVLGTLLEKNGIQFSSLESG